MKRKEQRFYSTEIRADESEAMVIAGYAAVFNKETKIGERFVESVSPGAFKESIASGDIRALWSHNPEKVIGRTKNGSLVLKEDDFGLAFRLKLPETSEGKDTFTLVKDGYVTGVSFGFRVKEEKWSKGDASNPHKRQLLSVELFEISPTAWPAYESTYVSAARDSEEALSDIEKQWALEESSENVRAKAVELELKERRLKLAQFDGKL